ncbi:MAG TPA: hypothetical protein VNO33_16920 [Kofleriaceae bacterium]|nr:hypothetical protein [Kofleriaceae bacterium]
MGNGRVLVIAALFGCGDGSAEMIRDSGAGTLPDGAASGDAASPDGSAGDAAVLDASIDLDAGLLDGAAPDATPGGDCPPLGPGDGLTPVWLEGTLSADPQNPGSAQVLGADSAPDCSVVVGGYTRFGPTRFGPGEAIVAIDRWFVARYRADGTFDWVADLGPRQLSDFRTLNPHFMPDGTIAVVRATASDRRQRSLTRLSADGEALGEPLPLVGLVVQPLADGGAYVAREYVLERITAAGDVVWSRSIGAYPRSITELADGRFLHAGSYDTVGAVLNGGQPDEQIIDTDNFGSFYALYRPDGGLEWVRTIDTDGVIVPAGGAGAADDWFAVWLHYPSVGDTVEFTISTGTGDPIVTQVTGSLVVVRYQSSGELAWYRIGVEGGGSQISLRNESFSVGAADGTITMGGVLTGIAAFEGSGGGYVQVSSEPSQAYYLRYSAVGDLLGPVTVSSDDLPGTSDIGGITTRADGSVVLAGTFTQTFLLAPLSLVGDTGGQAFAAAVH